MAFMYISFEDLSPAKQEEVIETYEEAGVNWRDEEELFYCQFTVKDDGEVKYE